MLSGSGLYQKLGVGWTKSMDLLRTGASKGFSLMESSRKSSMLGAIFCLLALLLAVPFAAHAQQYSGSITGTVTDPSGAAVAGATVTATNSGTNATYTATTTDLGAFTFPQMTVGAYEVRVKHPSFKEFVARSVEVHTSTAT